MQPAGTFGWYAGVDHSGQLTPFNLLTLYMVIRSGQKPVAQPSATKYGSAAPELQVLYVSMNEFRAQFQAAYKNGEIPTSSISYPDDRRC